MLRSISRTFINKNKPCLCLMPSSDTPLFKSNFHSTHIKRLPRQFNKHIRITPDLAQKFQILDERNAIKVHNTDEQLPEDPYPFENDEFDGINLQRGHNGVFEIEELVDILKRENGLNIFVVSVPRELNFVDYLCIVSGKSQRHVQALANFVRRVFKKKCNKLDPIPKLEGKESGDWIALDLGNIALHVFSEKKRKEYDLESLWALGSEFDNEYNKKYEYVEVLKNYETYLKDLKPLA